MKKTITATIVALALMGTVPVGQADAATKFANCKALNAVYPHGVGYKKGLVNKGGQRVAYKVDAATYTANKGKDRDHDGIACER